LLTPSKQTKARPSIVEKNITRKEMKNSGITKREKPGNAHEFGANTPNHEPCHLRERRGNI